MCSCFGKSYVANGERSTTIIEIEVRAHTRKIVRPQRRRTCDCPSSPMEVSAPPALRLFDNTPYRISVWTRYSPWTFSSATFRPQPPRKRSYIKADARHLDMRKCILTGNVPRYRAM